MTMPTQRYRYTIELYGNEGTCIGQAAASVDWLPALEWSLLQGIRKGQLQLSDGTEASAVRPIWHAQVGEPYVDGFRVTLPSENGEGVSEDFTTAYFKNEAQALRARLVQEGRVKGSDNIRYLTTASFDDQHAKAGSTPRFKTREVPPPVKFKESSLAGIVRSCRSSGESHPDDIPIVIPYRILDEIRELAGKAGAKETGGVLVGYLHWDPSLPEVFVEITAQIPAVHTQAGVDRLTFTPDTWTAAQVAVDRRREGEVFQGWWHFHPVAKWQCKNCPKDKKAACPLARGFLSAEDCQLHRAVFSRAYTCALVASDSGERDIDFSLFGWRRGLLESRGFHVLDNDRLRDDSPFGEAGNGTGERRLGEPVGDAPPDEKRDKTPPSETIDTTQSLGGGT